MEKTKKSVQLKNFQVKTIKILPRIREIKCHACTESNLEVIKPSVIAGTNSSSKLGASPFKYGTDVTSLDHRPKR